MPFEKKLADISVLIPTRDRPTALRRALTSIGAQEILPTEIIVLDQSRFPAELKDLKNAFKNPETGVGISIIHRPDLANKLTTARNALIQEAKCSWIQWMDDDSVLEKGYFKAILPLCAGKEYAAICGRIIEPKTRYHFLAKYFQNFFFVATFAKLGRSGITCSTPKRQRQIFCRGSLLFDHQF